MAQFVKTTLLGGAMFLLPLVLVFVLLREAIRHLAQLVAPVVKLLPAQAVGGVAMTHIVAVIILVAIAFLAGLVARPPVGTRLSKALEHLILKKMPGFTLLKSITGQEGDATDPAAATVALANIDDAWLFASSWNRTRTVCSRFSCQARRHLLPGHSISCRKNK